MESHRVAALPKLLGRKIYKTGQTRGADDDTIFQNRVARNSTVLIPYAQWEVCQPTEDFSYERGFIVLISPEEYFGNPAITEALTERGLELGRTALVFYEKRSDWLAYPPGKHGWSPATQRTEPLGGEYVARIAATTALSDGGRINHGFTQTKMKGAGIRVYEYASQETISSCRLQLEALFWMCVDSVEVASLNGMTAEEALLRKASTLKSCQESGLLQMDRLRLARLVNVAEHTICPLCLYELSSQGFFDRMAQAEGRVVHDLTVTELNLFHIEELRTGVFNHRPYNLGWGHHHCNVVVRDAGINETVEWMRDVVDRNDNYDSLTSSKRDT